MATLRRTVARSRLAPVAALPTRAAKVLRYDARVLGTSARWLVTSREHHNYTYDLTMINHDHLAWFVSAVCQQPIGRIRKYLGEIAGDKALRNHIRTATESAGRRGLADRDAKYGRRLGWYAIVRALKPAHVVEAGVDKGLGTVVLAAALCRNAAEGRPGRVTAIDINPDAGYLVKTGRYAEVVDLVYRDSVETLAGLDRPVDVFLHDSNHSPEHERRELEALEPHLTPDAMLLTDNVTHTRVLSRYAESSGRQFLAFTERPAQHWYPGDGIGAAWHLSPRRS